MKVIAQVLCVLASGCLWMMAAEPITRPTSTATNTVPPVHNSGSGQLQITSVHKSAFSGFTEPQTLVITNQAGWDAAWKKLELRQNSARQQPQVDFGANLVLLAAMGQKSSGGYSVAIQKAVSKEGILVVTVAQSSPPAGTMSIQALTAPVDAVKIPNPGAIKSVKWETVAATAESRKKPPGTAPK